MIKYYDVAVIGGGPCGVAALTYLVQAGYKCCLIEKEIVGGQPRYTTNITNLVGFEGTGEDLANMLDKKVQELNVDVYDLDFKGYGFTLLKMYSIEDKDIRIDAKAVVIATGSKPKKLEELEKANLKNIHYCSLCDGPLYKGKNVVVFGGGNSAITEALHLSKICNKVAVLTLNKYGFTATKSLLDEAKKADNIILSTYTGLDKDHIIGIENLDFPEKIDGIFVSIGRSPNSEMLDKSQLDKDGFIKVNKHFKVKTSYNNGYSKGLFAGGDVISKDVRQISTAISDGVIISQEVIKYLRRNIW